MLLQFGIPSLDELVEIPRSRDFANQPAESIAIMGADGTGKSVLSLHLASHYASISEAVFTSDKTGRGKNRPLPKILYLSSDLKFAGAKKIWRNFRLCCPRSRHIPFEKSLDAIERYKPSTETPLRLVPFSPENAKNLVNFLFDVTNPKQSQRIAFVDLASHTAGDDWSYVNTLLAKLQPIPSCIPHMLIVDSVAGFETLVGKLDYYGNEQSRRARIAQCIRNAGHGVNLAFVVEEPEPVEHLPEEYVTDSVLRLRNRSLAGSPFLTVEVQKSRARQHAKGEHPFEIREWSGTSTGAWENADTPRARNGYVQVFPSIAFHNKRIGASYARSSVKAENGFAKFGLSYLDDLLNKEQGLQAGTATALIGDPATGKSDLGEKFLAEGFRSLIENFVPLYAYLKGWPVNKDEVNKTVEKAFRRTYSGLESCIISPDPNRPLPRVSLPRTADGLMKMLHEASHRGHYATQESLKNSLEADYRGNVSGAILDRLKNLFERKFASQLAAVPDPPKADTWTPRSRSGWSLDWDQIVKYSDLPGVFAHPNLRFPGVLLTTADKRGTSVAETCLGHLQDAIDAVWLVLFPAGPKESGYTPPDATKLADMKKEMHDALLSVLDSQLIVRRFDMRALTGAAVFHIVQANLIEANRKIFGLAFPPNEDRRAGKGNRIRLVIDDLRVLSEINTELMGDGAMLPFLMFFLERQGVTSLLIHTDSLRPNSIPEDETSRTLLSILKRAILTWNVPFEGRNRIAIGVIPQWDPEKNGIVRELTLKDGKPLVTRKFELYSGIEEGRPKPVPLAVYIFNETRAFKDYVDEEDRLFRELFTSVENSSPVDPGRVIFAVEPQRYLAMRDYTHLYLDAKDGHTMVFQVDEYWALKKPHVLENLGNYLNGKLPSEPEEASDTDPFQLFSGPPQNKVPPKAPNSDTEEYSRYEYFGNCGYTYEKESSQENDANSQDRQVFRVPFMWDFGFLLVRREPWTMASEKPLFSETKLDDWDKRGIGRDRVKRIRSTIPFEKRCKVGEVHGELSKERGGTSWRKFLDACKQVAEVHYRQTGAASIPFDISCPSSETMNALLLEIWSSEMEIESDLLGVPCPWSWEASPQNLVDMLKGPRDPETGVQKTIKGQFEEFKGKAYKWKTMPPPWMERVEEFKNLPLGAFCLYKAWLLLIEVLQFDDFLDPAKPFSFREGHIASMHAVASRHWYKTACTFANDLYNSDGIHDSLEALRLPGHFSARGDWYLGSPASSRSKLLAQHAIDLLSSRRGNLARMQQGLGLPVRDVMDDETCRNLRTALRCTTPKTTENKQDAGRQAGKADNNENHHLAEITYGDLTQLGEVEGGNFHWLWRRSIENYDRQSRPLQKWLVRLFRWTNSYRASRVRQWRGGFPGYDELTLKQFVKVSEYGSFIEFAELCDFLCGELEAAQRR